jgi:FAD/FMN-containing dehydrogenase
VTADGDHIIANAFRNKDLFWALRGGGGGTWGVITSVTYKTHPSSPYSGALLSVNSTDADSTHKLFTEIIRMTPSLVEQGYGGYVIVSAQGVQFAVGSPNATAEQTRATFLPLFEAAHSLPGLSAQNGTAVSQYWLDFFLLLSSSTRDVGIPTELSSWLLPKDVVATDKPERLARELLKTSGFVYW